jgi:uncharacterized protein YbcI
MIPVASMIGTSCSKTDLETESVVRGAILNFLTKFLDYRSVQTDVHVYGDLIEISLTRVASIPAEDLLAQSHQGRLLLEQYHAELFRSGKHLLKEQLERDLGLGIVELLNHHDTVTRTTTIFVKLAESLTRSTT